MRRKLAIFVAGTALVLLPLERVGHSAILPTVLLLLMASVILSLRRDWGGIRTDVGPKWIIIPYFILVLFSLVQWGLNPDTASYMGVFFLLIAGILYLLGRELGPSVLWAFAPAALVEGGFVIYHVVSRGLIQDNNGYTNVSHFGAILMLLGIIFAPPRFRLPLFAVLFIPLILIGSEEAILGLGVLAFVAVIRRDSPISGRGLPIAISITILAAILIATGVVGNVLPDLNLGRFVSGDALFGGRWSHWSEGASSLASSPSHLLLGTGTTWQLGGDTIHNTPLRISVELGVFAGLSWAVLALGGLLRTRYVYAFSLIVAIAMIDNYMWTHLFPWFWVMLGVSAADALRNDRMFAVAPKPNRVVQWRRDTLHDRPVVYDYSLHEEYMFTEDRLIEELRKAGGV